MIDKRPPSESEVGANFTPPRPTGRGGKGGRGAVSEGAWGQGAGGAGESRPDTPTRHPRPDTPTRPPDPPTQKGWRGECERNARGMQRGRKAVMRAECEGNATAKARGQGAGGRSQRGRGEQPSQKRKRALALYSTTDKNTTLKPPRLQPFAPFGEGSDPPAPCPDPLPPTSLLFRLHPLASACIGFSPFASPCIRLQALSLPLRVGGSAGRVGVSGRGSAGRVCSAGRVGSALLPLPPAPIGAQRPPPSPPCPPSPWVGGV